jgi:hypothetical protein
MTIPSDRKRGLIIYLTLPRILKLRRQFLLNNLSSCRHYFYVKNSVIFPTLSESCQDPGRGCAWTGIPRFCLEMQRPKREFSEILWERLERPWNSLESVLISGHNYHRKPSKTNWCLDIWISAFLNLGLILSGNATAISWKSVWILKQYIPGSCHASGTSTDVVRPSTSKYKLYISL